MSDKCAGQADRLKFNRPVLIVMLKTTTYNLKHWRKSKTAEVLLVHTNTEIHNAYLINLRLVYLE